MRAVRGDVGVALQHTALDFHHAAHRVDDRGEFRPACHRRWS